MITIQRRDGRVFIHYKKEDIIVTLSLDMFEVRTIYDFLKDMMKNEGDTTVIDAVIEETAKDILDETGKIPSPTDILITASRNRREKVDQATRDFLLGDER